ncbi:MAG: DUF5103 domain-containing protein [Bacteroidales bacterium]|nr:MAG: DUF5103 domain-containing protein [Bacteroidales bacterium]
MFTVTNHTFAIWLITSLSILSANLSAAKPCLQSQENKINTVRIHKTGSELSEPIVGLGGNESITLTFDDLSDSPLNYSYTLIHCASDWSESKINKSDYLDGFETNPINEYQSSYSTTVPYTHYKLQIPNNDIKIKLSGNYLIRVLDTYNPERIIFEKKFMVVENLLTLYAKLRQAIAPERKETSQQIELSVATSPLSISNPHTDLIVIAIQNEEPQGYFYGIKPVFIRSNEIVYSSPDNLIFNGINEFRSFNTNSIRFISSGIKSIDQTDGGYSVLLLPSENNRKQVYSTQPDINGKYKINLENSDQGDIEADYIWVYFTLPYFDQLTDKEVYVYGELTDWKTSPLTQMQYSYQRSAYELRMQLKQGYYNYRYVVKDTKSGEIDPIFFEGNHSETENSYLILVYYKEVGSRYERLVGIRKLNSRISN